MGTTISGDTGVVFPDATTQSTAVTVATPFSINASAGAGAQLRLPEATANGVNYVAVKAPDLLAGDVTWTLPTADGTNGQYLQTNGAGQLAFATVPATSPGGTTGQVQFNNAGVFGGISAGTAGQILTSNGVGSAPSFATPRVKVWSSYTSTGSYVVPSGVTSIRIYAFGGGGDGTAGSTTLGTGGGGGGCAFGDYAVTPGQSITITISAKTVTVSDGATTLMTANPGQNATSGGAGGTASISGSITNGGANSGGAGGSTTGGGGGSSGSPLGTGFAGGTTGGGGGGWGGIGGSSSGASSGTGGGGGGIGGAGATGGGGGSGGAASGVSGGIGRPPYLAFTDPLLAPCNGTGATYVSANEIGAAGGVGGGGAGATSSGTTVGGVGGFGGGGGGSWSAGTGGQGGFGGGGGGNASQGVNGKVGGAGGFGGGGGGAGASPGTGGTGGAAICLIYA